jgi:CRISPR/Cas system-associated endoribonuclease Cas2
LKLYDLAESYQNIQNLLDAEGADQESLNMALTVIETEIQEKGLNIAVILQGLKNDAEIIKAEETRLANRRKALETKYDWLRSYLMGELEKAKITEIKSPTQTITIQNNKPTVIIADEKKIPARYLTVVPKSYVPNKVAILEAIKSGKKVRGAELLQGKSLRIR